jgi:hypothetical protein
MRCRPLRTPLGPSPEFERLKAGRGFGNQLSKRLIPFADVLRRFLAAALKTNALSRSHRYCRFMNRVEVKPTAQFSAFFVTNNKSIRRICPVLQSHATKLVFAPVENSFDACQDAFFDPKRRILLKPHDPFYCHHRRAPIPQLRDDSSYQRQAPGNTKRKFIPDFKSVTSMSSYPGSASSGARENGPAAFVP